MILAEFVEPSHLRPPLPVPLRSKESAAHGCVTMMGTGAIISRIAAVARAVTFRFVNPIIFIKVKGTARVIVTWTSLGVPASRLETVTPGFGSTLMQSAPGAASAGEVQVPAVYPFLVAYVQGLVVFPDVQ